MLREIPKTLDNVRALATGERFTPAPGATYIYALAEDSLGNVHYVGRTRNPAARLKFHAGGYASDLPVATWLNKRRIEGAPVIMYILEETLTQANELEAAWIAAYRTAGYALLNVVGPAEPDVGYAIWKRPVKPLPFGLKRN